MITVYTIAYNEERMLPFFIKWYRDRFPDCRIVLYDNQSTDNTVKICEDNNVEVITYFTNGEMRDSALRDIKNNCWKESLTDWVVVCDVDELVDIRPKHLLKAEKLRQTVFKGIGYNMVNKDGLDDYLLVNTGVRDKGYDKKVVFNKRFVREINYRAGAHAALPYGIVSDCTFRPILYHFRYMDRQYMIERYKEFASRLSEKNKANNWSFHYKFDAGKEFDRAARMCKAVRG